MRPGTPQARRFAAAALLIAVSCAERPTAGPVAASERLLVAEVHFGGAGETRFSELLREEDERLRALCPPPWPNASGCVTRNVRAIRYQVATMLAEPRLGSAPVANVYMVLRPVSQEFSLVAVGLDVELVSRPGTLTHWIADIGDWSYGVQIDGNVRIDGEWLQVLQSPVTAPAWLPRRSERMDVTVGSIAGELLELTEVVATGPDGRAVSVPFGSYFIERVSPSGVEFRREIASDFPCEEEEEADGPMPPTLRAPAGAFFAPDGTPRFGIKYTRGC